MATPASLHPDPGNRETVLLNRLLDLYEQESQIYGRVLSLSRQQGELVQSGGDLSRIRKVLEQKKGCLDTIGKLESAEAEAKSAWEKGRMRFSPGSRARLRETMQRVTDLIEEILICEEQNDRQLIEQARSM